MRGTFTKFLWKKFFRWFGEQNKIKNASTFLSENPENRYFFCQTNVFKHEYLRSRAYVFMFVTFITRIIIVIYQIMDYRDTRGYILDPCIQEFWFHEIYAWNYGTLCMYFHGNFFVNSTLYIKRFNNFFR